MNLKYMQVSLFEICCKKKCTFLPYNFFFLDVPVYEHFYKINAVLVTIHEFLLKYKIVMYPHFDLYIYIYIYIFTLPLF